VANDGERWDRSSKR